MDALYKESRIRIPSIQTIRSMLKSLSAGNSFIQDHALRTYPDLRSITGALTELWLALPLPQMTLRETLVSPSPPRVRLNPFLFSLPLAHKLLIQTARL